MYTPENLAAADPRYDRGMELSSKIAAVYCLVNQLVSYAYKFFLQDASCLEGV